jgi:rhamnulokinase
MCRYYLAIDIGASSGRHILGYVRNGKICLEEIYRFENGMKKSNGHLVWDREKLYGSILAGMKKCAELNKIPETMGIDTWGVDYVLLDAEDRVIGEMYGYRDSRTEGMERKVFAKIPEKELYARTGIQKEMFNTVYQLTAVKEQQPEDLGRAKSLLFVPDYFNFLLTGRKANEYTEASTSQLLNPKTRKWDLELIRSLGLPEKIFGEIVMPGTELGKLTEEMEKEAGFSCRVIAPCTHDTGSAVLAVPSDDSDFLYISSGTWSLLGFERAQPECSEMSRIGSFTNEGGYGGQITYLRNIMGLWMIQCIRHDFQDRYSFAEISKNASENRNFLSRVDVNDARFMAPESMTDEIRDYCRRTGQNVPVTLGELAAVVYASLAECYAKTIRDMEKASGRQFSRIHIVGGGANASFLNELTAVSSGKEVHAGPAEATAIGNILAQMLAEGEFESKEKARDAVHDSFDVKIYRPE